MNDLFFRLWRSLKSLNKKVSRHKINCVRHQIQFWWRSVKHISYRGISSHNNSSSKNYLFSEICVYGNNCNMFWIFYSYTFIIWCYIPINVTGWLLDMHGANGHTAGEILQVCLHQNEEHHSWAFTPKDYSCGQFDNLSHVFFIHAYELTL